MASLMQSTQGGTMVTSPSAVLGLVALLMTTLNAKVLLKVVEEKGAQTRERIYDVIHEDLEDVAANTRRMLRVALYGRFFKRYMPKEFQKGKYSYAFEMACVLTPDLVSLRSIEKAVTTLDLDSELPPEAIKIHTQSLQGHIWGLIRTMAIEAATKKEARDSTDAAAKLDEAIVSRRKRLRTDLIRSAVYFFQQASSNSQLRDLGLLDGDQEDEEIRGDVEGHVMTIAEVIDEEIEEFKNEFAPSNGCRRCPSSCKQRSMKYTVGQVLLFWKEVAEDYPNLAMVAKCVLGLPASSAAIERDFGISGLLLSSRRSRLGSAFVEMVMFLNINLDIVAWDTEECISTADAKEYLGRKYKRCTDSDDEEDDEDSSASLGDIEMKEGEEDVL